MRPLWPQPTNANSDGVPHEITRNEIHLIPPEPDAFRFDDEVGEESFFVAIRSQQSKNINLRTKIESYVGRGITYHDGSADADSYIYFAPTTASNGTVAAVKFQLQHQK